MKGKLPYLSSEQIVQLPLDRRSDVFALATTLRENAASAEAADLHELFVFEVKRQRGWLKSAPTSARSCAGAMGAL